MARFYRLVRLVIDLLVLRGRRDRSKDVEILVLRTPARLPTKSGPSSTETSSTSSHSRTTGHPKRSRRHCNSRAKELEPSRSRPASAPCRAPSMREMTSSR